MVQASPDIIKQELLAAFSVVAFQKVPDQTQQGKPVSPNPVVEEVKN